MMSGDTLGKDRFQKDHPFRTDLQGESDETSIV